MDEGEKVMCRSCGRLLGILQDGIFENKHGRQIIRAERALVVCPRCGTDNTVGDISEHDNARTYARAGEEGTVRKFKYRPNLGLSYARQGEIFFICLSYSQQPERVKEKIRRLCKTCGKEHEAALFEYLTTGKSPVEISMKYYLSDNTLWRAVRRFYLAW